MPLGSIIGAAGSLVSGIVGSSAAKGAGQTIATEANAVGKQLQQTTAEGQQGATQAASAAQGLVQNGATTANQYLNNALTNVTGATSPYQTVGNTATANLNSAYQPGGSLSGQFTGGGTFQAPTAAQVMATPGYGFQLQQGQQAIQRQAAAAGQYNSGATGKSLDAYSQGLAGTYYQNAYNNALQTYNTNYQTGLNTYQTNYGNTLNSLLAGSNLGLQGTSIYSNAALGTGSGLSANTTNAAQYMGNIGLQGAEYSGTLGLQGQEAAGQSFMQGAYGTAAGQVGSANSWLNAINGIAGAAGSGLAGFNPGGPSNPSIYSSAPASTYGPAFSSPLSGLSVPGYGIQP